MNFMKIPISFPVLLMAGVCLCMSELHYWPWLIRQKVPAERGTTLVLREPTIMRETLQQTLSNDPLICKKEQLRTTSAVFPDTEGIFSFLQCNSYNHYMYWDPFANWFGKRVCIRMRSWWWCHWAQYWLKDCFECSSGDQSVWVSHSERCVCVCVCILILYASQCSCLGHLNSVNALILLQPPAIQPLTKTEQNMHHSGQCAETFYYNAL